MQAQRILPADPGFAAYTDIRNLMNNVPVGSRKNGPDCMDFAHVEYISSGGLRALLTIEKLIEERDGDMRLFHVNENIMEIFELVGFTDVITVVQD